MKRYTFMLGQRLRWERKLLRFGIPNLRCHSCGHQDIRVLLLLQSTPSQDRSEALVLCRNCRRRRWKFRPARLQRIRDRFARAGYDSPSCTTCNEDVIQRLELHHPAGAANSTWTIPLCVNCHACQSDSQEDWLGALRLRDPNRGALARQGAWQIGIAMFLGAYTAVGAVSGSVTFDQTKTLVFLVIILTLVAWATWNVTADRFLCDRLGVGWELAIAAEIPA